MTRDAPMAIGLMFFASVSAPAQPDPLKLVKQIGVGWQSDKAGWMRLVSFSPNGKMVASDGATAPDDVSGHLSLWSFPEGRLIKRLSERVSAISPNWKYYVTDNAVREVDTGKLVLSLPKPVVQFLAFSPDSRYAAESHRNIRIIDLVTRKPIISFGKRGAFAFAFSPDGTAAAGYWNAVALWNVRTGERLAVLSGFGRYVSGLAFSNDGTLLAVGTDLGGLQIWNARTRARIQSIKIDGLDVSTPEFSPDGRLVTVGVYGTGTAWLIDVRTGTIVAKAKVSDLGCGSVAFSPDGRYLIAPSTGGLIKWPYDRGGTIRVFETPK
jgi:WD40 repeat protein